MLSNKTGGVVWEGAADDWGLVGLRLALGEQLRRVSLVPLIPILSYRAPFISTHEFYLVLPPGAW